MSSKDRSPGGERPTGPDDVTPGDAAIGRDGDTTEFETAGDAAPPAKGGDGAVGGTASSVEDGSAASGEDVTDAEDTENVADGGKGADEAKGADVQKGAAPEKDAEAKEGAAPEKDAASKDAAPKDADDAKEADGAPSSTAILGGGATAAAAGASSGKATQTLTASRAEGAPPRTSGASRTGAAAGKGKPPAKPPKKPRSRRARYARRALFGVLAFIGFCVAAFGIAYVFTPVPSPQQDAVEQGPTFLYSDGKSEIAKTGTNREVVPLSQVPKGVRDAVIAAENRSFYQDPGVSVKGTARAFWTTVTGEQLQGGSTITQQMVRNYYGGIGKERSVTRKLKEIMVSLKVGREKSKDWILEQYLNTIFFGRDAYGVQAAAKAYYDKDVKQLTPAEGAYLAAAIQQPTNFAEPTGAHAAYAEQRWRAVVGNMVRDGAVSQAEATAMTFPKPGKLKIQNVLRGQRGYMVNVAKKELIERRGYTEDEINRSGMKITTTFDKRLMKSLKDAVDNNVPKSTSKKVRTAAVSVDPRTGQVLAFYGGRDYLDEALSSAFGDWAQAGSGFKPIVLATALENGLGLGTTVDGSSPQYYAGSRVENDSGTSYGSINLVTATQNSVNTAYVNLGQKVGLDKVTRMAERLGISRDQLVKNGANTAPTFPLGVVSVHPVQQAGVFATFAGEGTHRTPFVVKSVTNNKDDKRDFTEKGVRVFSTQTARDATYAMEKVVQNGTGRGAQLPDGRPVAGKTGTTDEGRSIWFNGFIPQMATTVAMFRSDFKPLSIPGYSIYGGQLPAQIWNNYMSEAVNIKGYEQKEFGDPSSDMGGYEGPAENDGPTGPVNPAPGGRPTREPTVRPTEPGGSRPPTGRPSSPSTPGGGDGPGNGEGPGNGDGPGNGGGDNDGGGNNGGGDNDGGGDNGGGGQRPDIRFREHD
ncbi:transglycosylase domain-containing protein [Actinomadura hibisca]|uniref:transglycosylase domain-containing protein n=1 Tax=Actinomadura hibisca TaxID=68565 RepID=UPI000A90488B|nr:transglycosylase domain-containing protein [Actinomadura hibisca]